MQAIVIMPRICSLCDLSTQNYQIIANEVSPNEPIECICDDCLELVQLCNLASEKHERNEMAIDRRNKLKIIE